MTITINLDIDQSDMLFYHEVLRRMGSMALMKILRMKYPFLNIAQASELAKQIKETPNEATPS